MSPLNPLSRLAPFVDDFEPWSGPTRGVRGGDPLSFPGYAEVLERARERSGADEAVVTGRGSLEAGGGSRLDLAVVAGVFPFVGGSMGAAVGQRVVRAYERARRERLPVLVLTATGGARMQEGMVALVQMARTADAARRHAAAGLLQVAHLGSPTTGGVYASFASLADVIWAEPGATIGFAGPRVVEQTTGRALPEGAHSAESAHAAGLVDELVESHRARRLLATLLATTHLASHPHAEESRVSGTPAPRPPAPPSGSAWEEVERSRAPDRASGRTWTESLLPERVELRGDRAGGVDPVVVAALGVTEAGTPLAALGLDRHTGDGRPRPAGYRAARRLLRLAGRLRLPVATFVDTPGADLSHESETGGIAGEIARTFATLGAHPAPTASLVVGEGGSGGALALAATDRLWMLDGSTFSVIAPEGAASILHRDPDRAPELADQLGLTGAALTDLGIVDGVVDEATALPHLERSLAEAAPGDGRRRFDAATERWLHR